ncbi:MAG: hypothetical protein IT381_22020 [Deltaproteobacteria bacterium]|nr:hypothetical protein [Deltaproteobacteria bacterium]
MRVVCAPESLRAFFDQHSRSDGPTIFALIAELLRFSAFLRGERPAAADELITLADRLQPLLAERATANAADGVDLEEVAREHRRAVEPKQKSGTFSAPGLGGVNARNAPPKQRQRR